MIGFHLGGVALIANDDVVCHVLSCSKVDGSLLMNNKRD
jgi:hypothetical protein